MSRATEAMRAVDRRRFLPSDQQRQADVDAPVPLGHGVTNSQPTTVRIMLDLLDAQPGDRVLDVGAGSGWTTALLAWQVGEHGTVLGVERVPELVAFARERIVPDEKHLEPGSSGAFRQGLSRVAVRQAEPGVLGWPRGAPYDRILVSAEATQVPQALVDQLAIGGVLVVPVRGEMVRIVRTAGDEPTLSRHGRFRFVPLLE